MGSYYACSACAGLPYLDVGSELEWCDDCNRCGRCCLRDPLPTCHYVPEPPPVEVEELGLFCPLTSIGAGKGWGAQDPDRRLRGLRQPYFNPLTGERMIQGRVLSEPVFYKEGDLDCVFFTVGSVVDTPDGHGTTIEPVDVLLEGKIVLLFLHNLEKGTELYTVCREQVRWVRTSSDRRMSPVRVHVSRTAGRGFGRGLLRG